MYTEQFSVLRHVDYIYKHVMCIAFHAPKWQQQQKCQKTATHMESKHTCVYKYGATDIGYVRTCLYLLHNAIHMGRFYQHSTQRSCHFETLKLYEKQHKVK